MHTFERRVRSFAIDTSLSFILVFICMALSMTQIIPSQAGYYSALAAYVLVNALPYLFGTGQTLGKRVEKMQVVNIRTNQVPNRFLLVLRELFKSAAVIFTFGMYVIVGGIIFNSREDGRTIHDFIFRTKVICLTKYITDGKEQYIQRTETAAKSLKGSGFDD